MWSDHATVPSPVLQPVASWALVVSLACFRLARPGIAAVVAMWDPASLEQHITATPGSWPKRAALEGNDQTDAITKG